MPTKDDLIDIFNELHDYEINNKLESKIINESDLITHKFQEAHYVFINNVTIGFDELQFDDDNLRFYFDNTSVAAVYS
jgi:hypothetical protein